MTSTLPPQKQDPERVAINMIEFIQTIWKANKKKGKAQKFQMNYSKNIKDLRIYGDEDSPAYLSLNKLVPK